MLLKLSHPCLPHLFNQLGQKLPRQLGNNLSWVVCKYDSTRFFDEEMFAGVGREGDGWQGRGLSGKEDVREDGGDDSRSEKLSYKCRGANIEVLEDGS